MADLLKKDEIEAHTLLTVKEVREVFGIARSTVYRWIDRCWLRKAGQVQAPEDYKNQKIVLLELADEDLLEQFSSWLVTEQEAGRTPRFFAEDLARVDPVPNEEVDPRIESKRLIGELENLMGRLDPASEERHQLVHDLDAAPAIHSSGLKQAEDGLNEIVDLLKEISVREDDLREESVELPAELKLPPQAGESDEFTRELGEERGTGLEDREATDEQDETPPENPDNENPDNEEPFDETFENVQVIDDDQDIEDGPLAEEIFGLDLGDTEAFEGFQPKEIAEFAFMPDPETLGEDGEWIELNIDDTENPLLKEELLALDESFLPGAKRRGIEIDFEKGMLSETELDELAAQEAAGDDTDNALSAVDSDEENDSWLGISIAPEQESPGELAEDPYDPTGDYLEGEELRLLHATVEKGEEVEGFYLEAANDPGGDSEVLDLDLTQSDEGWGDEGNQSFDEGCATPSGSFDEPVLEEPAVSHEHPPAPQTENVPEDWMPGEMTSELGISEHMLTGEDAVDLEPDDEVQELEDAYAAEHTDTPEHDEPDELTAEDLEEPQGLDQAAQAEALDLEDILSEVDVASVPGQLEEQEDALLSLEDLEDDGVLMSLDDLDDDLDFGVEIETDDEEVPSTEDSPIQAEEADEPELSENVSPSAGVDAAVSVLEDEVLLKPEPAPQETVETKADETTADETTAPVAETPVSAEPAIEEESIPVAAQAAPVAEPSIPPATQIPMGGLTAEALESSAEMIKEGMIGIRLSILEVKEGLGILQDPVDSVSRNTEKVSQGVLEIANETRETRRSLEDLGARLENLDFSALRSSVQPRMPSGGSLVTGVGLALLVLTWCLGLYLRGEGSPMSLYVVFGANLLITLGILMLKTPRAVILDE